MIPPASPLTPSAAERVEESGLEWFYVDGGGLRRGPHNFRVVRAQLRCGVLVGTDLVWREGLSDWRPATEFSVFASCVSGGNGTSGVYVQSDAGVNERDDGAVEHGHDDQPKPATTSPTEIEQQEKTCFEESIHQQNGEDDASDADDDKAAWHASRSDGTSFGPCDLGTLVMLLEQADTNTHTDVETLVWHPTLQTEWGAVEQCAALLEAMAKRTLSSTRIPRSPGPPPANAAHSTHRRVVPSSPIVTDARQTSEVSYDDVTHTTSTSRFQNKSPLLSHRASASELLDLLAQRDAELLMTREALDQTQWQNSVLEAELEATRERAAQATAFAEVAAGAEVVAKDLSTARRELELQTHELQRLKRVLKGKLLARVLAEVDETRERVGVLDVLDDENRGGVY